MLVDVNIKLLLINIHKSLDSHIGGTYNKTAYNNDGLKVPIEIPFPLEVDINNFNLYQQLDKLPGIKNFGHVGNVVSNVSATITVNTVQKSAAPSGGLLSTTGMPMNDSTGTNQQNSLTQQPAGKQLHLRIVFEPKSLLPGLLFYYLEAAAKNVKDYSFHYISNELVATDLVLGEVSPDFSAENIVMDILFIEKLGNQDDVGSIANPGSTSLGEDNIK